MTCQKQFTIPVTQVNLSGYWTFDNTGPVVRLNPLFAQNMWAWLDEVSALVLHVDLPSSIPYPYGVSGKIALGIGRDTNSVRLDCLTLPGHDMTTQTGFAIFAWFRYVATPFGNMTVMALQLNVTGNPAPGVLFNTGTGAFSIPSGASATPVINPGVFFFLAYTYNNATGEEILYFNGTPLISGFLPTFPGVSATTELTMQTAGNTVRIDEVGVAATKLYTPAQITALYNSGNGLTWPAVNSV